MSTPPELVDAGIGVLRDYAARGETLTYGDLNRELDSPFRHGADFPGTTAAIHVVTW